jgi:uncharacterized protein YciI
MIRSERLLAVGLVAALAFAAAACGDDDDDGAEDTAAPTTGAGNATAEDEMYFAVIREPGARWDPAKPLQEQSGWPQHLDFMTGLADDGLIIVGGPLGDGRRALHVMQARSETEIRRHFDEDPWEVAKVLSIASVEPWQPLLGVGLPSRSER